MMKLVFFSVVLNQHQAPVADELWEQTGHQYAFVETIHLCDAKGGTEDYSQRPYLIRAWESQESFNKAKSLARTAECCVFSGTDALPFQKERMRLGLLSFDMGERWFKRGWKSMFSPRLLKWLSAYYWGGWYKKPLYKLCISGFAAYDHHKLGTFKGKCYKWGYITKVENISTDCFKKQESSENSTHETSRYIKSEESQIIKTTDAPLNLMWCARYIDWKHPELPILLAKRLKDKGYQFHLDMYGDGEYRDCTQKLASELGLYVVPTGDAHYSDITIHGEKPNDHVRNAMRHSDIFLFTSDRYEGWGAVANESMSCGCVLVASDAIGSTSYLVNDGVNGCTFSAPTASSSFNNPDPKALESLTEKVINLLNDKTRLHNMRRMAIETMHTLWNPRHAAKSLLQLIYDLQNGRDSSIPEGPCSKA